MMNLKLSNDTIYVNEDNIIRFTNPDDAQKAYLLALTMISGVHK